MNWRRMLYTMVVVLVTAIGFISVTGYRSLQLYNNVKDVSSEIKYLIENGGTIGEVPADSALSSAYLDIILVKTLIYWPNSKARLTKASKKHLMCAMERFRR
jgi:hypothetical protein